MTKNELRPTWHGMKQRCLNQDCPQYHYYGGRGITICKRWMKFNNFIADMGPRPNGLTLDRINNNGNYEPSNCRWATRKQQANNTRATVLYKWHNKKYSRTEFAKILKVSVQVIKTNFEHRRIQNGRTITFL